MQDLHELMSALAFVGGGKGVGLGGEGKGLISAIIEPLHVIPVRLASSYRKLGPEGVEMSPMSRLATPAWDVARPSRTHGLVHGRRAACGHAVTTGTPCHESSAGKRERSRRSPLRARVDRSYQWLPAAQCLGHSANSLPNGNFHQIYQAPSSGHAHHDVLHGRCRVLILIQCRKNITASRTPTTEAMMPYTPWRSADTRWSAGNEFIRCLKALSPHQVCFRVPQRQAPEESVERPPGRMIPRSLTSRLDFPTPWLNRATAAGRACVLEPPGELITPRRYLACFSPHAVPVSLG